MARSKNRKSKNNQKKQNPNLSKEMEEDTNDEVHINENNIDLTDTRNMSNNNNNNNEKIDNFNTNEHIQQEENNNPIETGSNLNHDIIEYPKSDSIGNSELVENDQLNNQTQSSELLMQTIDDNTSDMVDENSNSNNTHTEDNKLLRDVDSKETDYLAFNETNTVKHTETLEETGILNEISQTNKNQDDAELNEINSASFNTDNEPKDQPYFTANNTLVQTPPESSSPPQLPKRNVSHEIFNTTEMEDVPLTSSADVSKVELSPRLPPRKPSLKEDISPKNPVPPPLSEELKSPIFRKNMEMFNQETVHHHKYKQLKQRLVSNISSMPLPSKQPSAADVNLIINRYKVSNGQIDEINPSVRESIEIGQNILKSSFDALMTHGEDLKENLLNNTIPSEKLSEEEAMELKEITETNWTFWTQVVNDFATVANKESEQLEYEITKGVPRQIRGIIWQLIANSKSREMEDIYETLLETESPHEPVIRRDLNRTNFIPKERCEELFRVLKVYSIYDPDVGYTQGMAFITTPLLLNCNSEAEAFGLLVSLMKYYNLRKLYLPGMPGLMLMLYQFDRLLEENTPKLANHLVREGIRSSMYATQWFLTVFAYKFPLEFVLKIFDILFFEGIESLLKFAVNLMIKNEESLITLKFDQLLSFLKNELFNVYLKEQNNDKRGSKIDSENKSFEVQKISSMSNSQVRLDATIDTNYNAHLFVKDAMQNIVITPISLHRYAAEYDSINQMEKRRETEYDSMKIKNFQLQRERDKLEHDYKILNKEHVAIAKELIQYRLNIETLLDENNDLEESLKSINEQIEEEITKSQVPNPDSDLPVDLKQDLERTIKRNSEVTTLNTLLQTKITELENTIKELKTINKGFASTTSKNGLNTENITLPKSDQTNTLSSPTSNPPPTHSNDTNSNNMPNVNSTFTHGWSGFKKVFKK